MIKTRSLTLQRAGQNALLDNRTPPHSEEAEKGVLCSMMRDPRNTITECVEKITVDHFYVPAHRVIFDVLVDLWSAKQAIDLITFTQVLRDRKLLENVGGAGFVTELQDFVPTAANVGYYIDIVREMFTRRNIIRICAEQARRCYEIEGEDSAALLCDAEQQFGAIKCSGRNGQFPQIEDGAALIAKPIILPDDVIVGVLHHGGKMVLGGASKSYKTWLHIDTAISVATGTHWLGRFPTKRGRVLYINLEIQSGFFAKRIKTICDERQLKIEEGYLRVWNLRGHAADVSTLLPRLLRGIGRDQFILIIIDPIYKLLGGRDENKAGDIATLLNEIESLAVATGAGVAFGAHYSKGNQASKESIDRVGGSGVFARDPDTILNFTRHEQEDCFTVDATLRNHPPIQPFVVRWEYPLMCPDDTLDPAKLKKPKIGLQSKYQVQDLETVLAAECSKRSGIAGPKTVEFQRRVCEETGMSKATFYELLRQGKGQRFRKEDDFWQVVQKVQKVQ